MLIKLKIKTVLKAISRKINNELYIFQSISIIIKC